MVLSSICAKLFSRNSVTWAFTFAVIACECFHKQVLFRCFTTSCRDLSTDCRFCRDLVFCVSIETAYHAAGNAMVLPMEISRYGSASKWQMNERGEWVMPEKQAQFLEWLMADIRIPETMLEWAEANDLHKDTPVRWKQDKRFIEKWEEAARKKNISMDRVQSVIDSIYEQAANGNIKAASLYLQYVDRFTPTQRVITEDEQVAKLSDEELDEQLRALLND